MSDFPYRTALVTGASSGIGASIVARLRESGLEVHAIARDAGRLAELAEKTGCISHAISVEDYDALARLTQEIPFDVLVNNAGQSRSGNIAKTTREDIDSLVDVNLRAVLQLTHLIVPGMVERDRGHIVNISSIAGHYAFAGEILFITRPRQACIPVSTASLRLVRIPYPRHRNFPGTGRNRSLRPPDRQYGRSQASIL